MAIERIFETDTGEVGFEKADRNFLGIENGSLPVGSTKSIYTQVITDLNTHNIDGFFKYNSNAVGAYNVLPGIVRHESYDGGLAYQMCAPYGTIGMCVFRVKLNAVWGAWEKIVTDKPVDWITGTLKNGWGGSLYFRKNQIGQIEVKGMVSAGTVGGQLIICDLPIGYYTSGDTVMFLARNTSAGASIVGCLITAAGEVRIDATSIATGNNIAFNFLFNL